MKRNKLSDLLLPVLVVSVIAMLILPLPAVFLDILLMCNISFGLALLVSSVYLNRPERFTSLPSVLLLSTLFRLGLNVSTTRQILATGTAPKVVESFGEFVVGGNIIVGLVLFGIVTLVQFFVIAKGAERVAEVAARFALDAMPGKQMSVDADVRAGLMSVVEARVRREELQCESRLYGALDGAMKFVKGDALAGLLITVINLSAGVCIGIFSLSMGFVESFQRFALFTVGDGLCSQIPALLVAVSAGIAVTRVSSKQDSLVGEEIFSHLTANPQAMRVSAVFCMVMAFIPGMPATAFIAMSTLLFYVSSQTYLRLETTARASMEREFRPRLYGKITVLVSKELLKVLQKEKTLPRLNNEMRRGLFEEYGVIAPDPEFEVSRALHGASSRLLLHGEVVGEFNYSIERGSEVKAAATEMVVDWLRSEISLRLGEFLDDEQTRELLELHSARSEAMINSIIPEVLTITGLTQILRQLVIERVSIRELNRVLQAISEHKLGGEHGSLANMSGRVLPALSQAEPNSNLGYLNLVNMLSDVRVALSRTICRQFCGIKEKVKVVVLSTELDCLLSGMVLQGVAVDPDLADALLHRSRGLVSEEQAVAIVCSRYSRWLMATIVGSELSSISVLSTDELLPDMELDVVCELTFPISPAEEGELNVNREVH